MQTHLQLMQQVPSAHLRHQLKISSTTRTPQLQQQPDVPRQAKSLPLLLLLLAVIAVVAQAVAVAASSPSSPCHLTPILQLVAAQSAAQQS
jgi:hypothetical protein